MADSKITFSKEIASTLGLEEAILVEFLKSSKTDKPVSFNQISQELNFWNKEKLTLLLENLLKVGLVSNVMHQGSMHFIFKKTNQKIELNKENKWIPDKEVLDQITEYGIPEDFANLQIDDFKKLSEEKNETSNNWGIKFLRFVIKKWRFKEAEDNKKKKTKPIAKDWSPDDDAIEILIKSGVNEDFIDKEIAEFILYWSERKEESDIWNSKFIAHIRRQWGRFKDVKENDNLPSKMTSEWNPNQDFFDILELTEITKEFAENAKPEFIMYWKETGQSLTSWNSKFLQHVKFHWEKTNKGQTPQISQQIDRRIESSWKIQENNQSNSKKLDTQTVQENLKRLKDKHQI
ncbi:MAG: DnaT-like ssDNA-binding domain-containing protein [SAR86 cluster bacterium]|nr:DnaT-like ssDNA-binding domain-containing protein [SAR86 cluster bacterium]